LQKLGLNIVDGSNFLEISLSGFTGRQAVLGEAAMRDKVH